MSKELRGGCLCGRVQFLVHGPFDAFRLCYCSRCRKVTGSAHASNLFGRAENLRWLSGEDMIRRFELDSASYFARSFCAECGAAVPWISRRDARTVVIPAGALDDEPDIHPQQRIFCADRASWSNDIESVAGFERLPD